MIENGDAHLFAIDNAGVIDPIGWLAPYFFFVLDAFGIDDEAGFAGDGPGLAVFLDVLVFVEQRVESYTEGAVLGVAQSHVGRGGEQDVDVDDAELVRSAE